MKLLRSAWRPQILSILAGLLLAAFVVGARWGIVARFGTDLPIWDQWDAEGLHSLAPWLEHKGFWRELFQAHNEHHVVLTKLVNLGLTLLNGCWDQRLECIFNAFLPAGIAASLFWFASRFCQAGRLALVWALLAALWGLPFAWQNIVAGFHSQQLFLIGLSCGAIIWLPFSTAWTGRWWAGALCATFALGSMASGFLACVIALPLIGWQILNRKVNPKSLLPSVAVCLLIIFTGLLTRVTVAGHAGLKASSFSDFLLTLGYSLQWPLASAKTFWLIPFIWAPWLCLAVLLLRDNRGGKLVSEGLVLLGLGGWVWLQLLVTAYVRGDGGLPPPSRYVDTLVFGITINGFSLAWLAARRSSSLSLHLMALMWISLLTWAGQQAVRHSWAELQINAEQYHRWENHTRNYLLTDNPIHLTPPDIPYPEYASFLARINRPSLKALMPSSVRPPMTIHSESKQGFVRTRHAVSPENTALSLPPGISPLVYEPYWSSWSPATDSAPQKWASGLLTTKADWIEMRYAGSGTPEKVSLEIRDARSDSTLALVHPKADVNGWETVRVFIPSHEFIIIGEDTDASGWLAFNSPVEIFRWSSRAEKAGWLGWTLAKVALGGATLLLLAGWLQARLTSQHLNRA